MITDGPAAGSSLDPMVTRFPPPVGNTGVEMTGVGLGWLQGTIKWVKPQQVLHLLSDAIGSEAEDRPGGTRWYSESATIGLHALAAWAPRNRPDAVETYFEVRQSALDELGGAASLSLAAQLQDLGARFSRVDGYYDDRVRRVESSGVAEAFRRGDTLTHVRRMKVFNKFTTAPDGDVIPDGSTVYIGSATSAAMLRVYDKAAESGRPDAGVRWELQLRHEHATRFVAGAVASGDRLGAYVLGSIRDLVDFRDRSGHGRGDRSPLLDWWAAIVGDAERVGLNGPARVDSLARRGAWLERQAAPSLALLYFAHGPDWLNDLLRSGQERLTETERRLLAAWFAKGVDTR
jgi:Replication initiation factor